MSVDDLGSTLAKLRDDYAAQLPLTVAQMEDLWRRLVATERTSSQLAELVRMAHTITGSGATFGFPGVTRAARELETFLDKLGGSGRRPGTAEQAAVSALFAALRQAAVRQ